MKLLSWEAGTHMNKRVGYWNLRKGEQAKHFQCPDVPLDTILDKSHKGDGWGH